MLRGNFSAKIDEKGRLKIPTIFRTLIQDKYGSQLFVTSVTGEFARLYPMAVWEDVERKLAEVPTTLPARGKFFNRVNYYGQPGELDRQGRVSIHPRLRDAAAMIGDVDVFAPAVVSTAGVTLRILVREHRTGGFEDGSAHEVLRGN